MVPAVSAPKANRRPEEKKSGRRQIELPIAKIVELHAAGLSKAALARRFGVTASVITDRLKRAGQGDGP